VTRTGDGGAAGPGRACLARVLLAVALLTPLTGCSRDPYGGFDHPRMVRLAPDGRLLVTDLGTGRGDGRVVAIDPRGRRRTLLDRLPSTRGSGQRYSDLAGPSGADVAPDGTVCAVIGDAARQGAGFGSMRCSDGRAVDLEAFERRANPDGLKLENNPYDVVSDLRGGWYVSDAAANTVLHVDRGGRVQVAAVFASLRPFAGRAVQGVPTGLTRAPGGGLYVTLLGGAPFGDGAGAVVALAPAAGGRLGRPVSVARVPFPVAALPTGGGLAVVSLGARFDDPGGGRILLVPPAGAPRTVAAGLARPTGLARLSDGRFVVAEESTGHVRVRAADRAGT
jgi:hypothetical protein